MVFKAPSAKRVIYFSRKGRFLMKICVRCMERYVGLVEVVLGTINLGMPTVKLTEIRCDKHKFTLEYFQGRNE